LPAPCPSSLLEEFVLARFLPSLRYHKSVKLAII
jgi:hypothetical protein